MLTTHESEKFAYVGATLALILGLYASGRYSYLLFHSLVEVITISLAFALFILTWNARRYLVNNYLRLLGYGYGFIALIDLVHTLAYKGMGVFSGFDANLPTQLWIAARYLQAFTLTAAVLFLGRKLDDRAVFASFIVAVSVLLGWVFAGYFPDCFIEGRGLTVFKIDSEYLISVLLLVGGALFYAKRSEFDAQVFLLIAASIVCTIASELAFTTFVSVYGMANMVGHFAKLMAFYLIYRAIFVTGLRTPYQLIFRDLKQADEALRVAHGALQQEVVVRKQTEVTLLAEKQRHEELIRELAQAHSHLLQVEKLASIGHLAAGVAHEINNPIGFINSNLGTLQRYTSDMLRALAIYEKSEGEMTQETRAVLTELKQQIDFVYLREDIGSLLSESLAGLLRVKRIVQDLRDFSHVGEAEKQFADLEAGLDSTLNVMSNEFRQGIEVVKAYGGIPEIECMPSQINQVFMNILLNAVQAIDGSGQITVRTGRDNGSVWVEVQDSGKGIKPEEIDHIFDPFFTTKSAGSAVGLGLSLCYGIVRRHGGRIDVKSELGKGSVFRVVLPGKPTWRDQCAVLG
jgi:signal transduction histidine kinase